MSCALKLTVSAILLCIFPLLLHGQNTQQDIDVAVTKCGVSSGDMAIIPKLESATQKQLTAWIAAHDCKNLKAFVDSRSYYRLVNAGAKLPPPPADLSLDYLMWPELKRLATISLSLNGPAQFVNELKPADIDFLVKQCAIDRADVDVIAKLDVDAQSRIFSWISGQDCKHLVPFKASRQYYRSLTPGQKIPMPPAGWDGSFLTEVEFARYADILAKAPW
ncbi:MAG TPA: hypothetical protein VFB10_09900 [Candidatus Dormibacteraeota bacterium]|nr:hypothetical protein [Candidatus Dormibacteraeota bacterium]